MTTPLTTLVTGGSGFIGSHVVDKLLARGHRVRLYDLHPSSFHKDVEHFRGDVCDLDSLSRAMEGVDAVFHLAAVADVKDVETDPYRSEEINVRGTLSVLEASRRARSIPRLIYASTTWVYGAVNGVSVDETTPLQPPDHFYTTTKIAAEWYCHAYQRRYGVPVTILRYGIPYGPRARAAAVIPAFVGKALRGEPLVIAGDGSQFRKFVYVEDLAEGNVLALSPAAVNRTYNLDGVEKVTIKRLADLVRTHVRSVPLEHTAARPGDFGGKDISSERARIELGWTPRVGIEEGLRRYLAWRLRSPGEAPS